MLNKYAIMLIKLFLFVVSGKDELFYKKFVKIVQRETLLDKKNEER
jgi:hypothetical protein